MSYNFVIAEQSPSLYIPINVREGGSPVDLLGNNVILSGDFSVISKKYPKIGDFLSIPDSSYLKSESGSTNSSLSVGIWVYLEEFGEEKSVFFCGSSNSGFGCSITSSGNLRIYRNGSTSYVSTYQFDEGLSFIVFSIENSTMYVYLNGELEYSTGSYSLPDNNNFYVGSLWNESGAGALEFSQIFQIEPAISSDEANGLYEIGAFGYEKISFDSSSSINVSDGDQNFLQTSWQAYGIVTVKG